MTEEAKRRRWPWWVRGPLTLTGCTAIVVGFWAAGQGLDLGKVWLFEQAAEATQWAERKLTREVVVREFIDPDTVPTEMLIEQVAAEQGLPVELLQAMAIKESGKFNSTNRVRFESHIYEKFQRIIPDNLNEIERQLWASSHGILQVIWVYHYKACGLEGKDWTALHDPLTNLRCGALIFRDRWARFKDIKNLRDRLFMALRAYNGDITKPETATYAEKIMNNMIALRSNEILSQLK